MSALLMIPVDEIDRSKPMNHHGLGSLVAVVSLTCQNGGIRWGLDAYLD